MGFRKADDFYIALGGAKISPKVVAQKVHAAPQAGRSAAEGEPTAADILSTGRNRRRPDVLLDAPTGSTSRGSTT